jgi:hypothetical protein
MYLETKLFLLIIFYNNTFSVIKILIVFTMNACMCVWYIYNFFAPCIMVGVTALTEFLFRFNLCVCCFLLLLVLTL